MTEPYRSKTPVRMPAESCIPKPGCALAGTALALCLGSCTAPPETAPPSPRPVAWTHPEQVDGFTIRRLPGVVRPVETAALSFEVPGHIAEIRVEIGDAFRKGDTLARLDARTYRLRVKQSRAELSRARATAAEARVNLRRIQAILSERATTEAEFDRATAEAESTESQVKLLEASLDLARKNLHDTVLVAPYDGRLTRRQAEPSQQVAAGQAILEIQGEREGLEVQVSIPETLVGHLELGSRHTFRLSSRPRETYRATLTNIAADSLGPHVFPASLKIEDAGPRVRPGRTVEVDLRFQQGNLDRPPLLRIPVASLVGDAADSIFVFVVGDDDVAKKRPVTVEHLSGDSAMISEGVADSDFVVTHGAAFLHDGQRVSRLDTGIARYNP